MAMSLMAMPPTQAAALTRAEAGSSVAIAQSQMSEEDVSAAAQNAGIAGASALATYLAGGTVTDAEFLSIDAVALAVIDEATAQEISSYQQILQSMPKEDSSTEPPAGDTDQGAEQPGTDEGAKEDPATPGTDEGADGGDAGDEEKSGENTSEPSKDPEDSNESDDAMDGSASDGVTYDENGTTASSENAPAQTTSTVVRSVSVNLTTQKFIAIVGEQAREVAAENDLFASVMIAQAILESASGNSSLAASPNNNLFGIKGAYKGQSVVMRTQEDDGSGNLYGIAANFRKYDTMRESLEDYADLFTGSMAHFYAGARKSNAESWEDVCDYLQGRYATSTTYASSLKGIIEAYGLTKYDEPLSYETVETYEMPAIDEETGEARYDENGDPVMEKRTLTDLVVELTSHLGEDYVWGGTTCGSFDCSGLAQYCYKQALGVDIPRVSDDQSKVGDAVEIITEDELLERNDVSTDGLTSEEAAQTLKEQLIAVDFNALHMGDLLFWANEDGYVYHTAIYLGEGCYIQAPQAGDVVRVTSLAECTPTFAMRVVDVQPTDTDVQEAQPSQELKLSEVGKKINKIFVVKKALNRCFVSLDAVLFSNEQ